MTHTFTKPAKKECYASVQTGRSAARSEANVQHGRLDGVGSCDDPLMEHRKWILIPFELALVSLTSSQATLRRMHTRQRELGTLSMLMKYPESVHNTLIVDGLLRFALELHVFPM
jgi:hypothetical protein